MDTVQEIRLMQGKRQTGFTLVEIAIVLVIIGLLIGGVLKGQSMITNAKIRKIESDFRETRWELRRRDYRLFTAKPNNIEPF